MALKGLGPKQRFGVKDLFYMDNHALITIRDLLGFADTGKEARSIIASGKVMVDGKVVKNYKYPLGFMDVLSFKGMDKNYRILLDLALFCLGVMLHLSNKYVLFR